MVSSIPGYAPTYPTPATATPAQTGTPSENNGAINIIISNPTYNRGANGQATASVNGQPAVPAGDNTSASATPTSGGIAGAAPLSGSPQEQLYNAYYSALGAYNQAKQARDTYMGLARQYEQNAYQQMLEQQAYDQQQQQLMQQSLTPASSPFLLPSAASSTVPTTPANAPWTPTTNSATGAGIPGANPFQTTSAGVVPQSFNSAVTPQGILSSVDPGRSVVTAQTPGTLAGTVPNQTGLTAYPPESFYLDPLTASKMPTPQPPAQSIDAAQVRQIPNASSATTTPDLQMIQQQQLQQQQALAAQQQQQQLLFQQQQAQQQQYLMEQQQLQQQLAQQAQLEQQIQQQQLLAQRPFMGVDPTFLAQVLAQPTTDPAIVQQKLTAIDELNFRNQVDPQSASLLLQELQSKPGTLNDGSPEGQMLQSQINYLRQASAWTLGTQLAALAANGTPPTELPGIGKKRNAPDAVFERILKDKTEDANVKMSALQALMLVNKPNDPRIKQILKEATGRGQDEAVKQLAKAALNGETIMSPGLDAGAGSVAANLPPDVAQALQGLPPDVVNGLMNGSLSPEMLTQQAMMLSPYPQLLNAPAVGSAPMGSAPVAPPTVTA
ncbi:MAG: hypothetical protein SFZ03_00865 [Candidatus Melainabacteria bacterium]|nr:hypothetical protein [Candidatus Melainabacteria bacterium]